MKVSRSIGYMLLSAPLLALALAVCASLHVPAAYADAGDVHITGKSSLEQLSRDVSAGDTFEGKTVVLDKDLDLEGVASWTPIGSPEHPFCGSFDGNKHSIGNLALSVSEQQASFVGLFGYVGPGGSIKDLTLENCTVEATASTCVMRNIGSLAGYVYGDVSAGAFAIEGCETDAKVSVVSTMGIDGDKMTQGIAPDGALEAGFTDEGRVMEYIGGLVGYCAGSMKDCAFQDGGTVLVRTDKAPDPTSSTMAAAVGGVAGQVGGYVVAHPLENEMMRYEPVYPTEDGKGSYTASAREVTGCSNAGSIVTVVNCENGLDRFGVTTSAKLSAVGGVVGFGMCSFTDCSNAGYIESPTGDGTGGVCGVLRGITFSGSTYAAADAGIYKPQDADESARLHGPLLTMQRCVNSATVIALHAGGGICGGSGTYTAFKQCFNAATGEVHGCRWNKPMMGGIVGQTYGSVSYCYNRGTVSSDAADDDDNPTRNANGNVKYVQGKGKGYYCAGVLGTCYRFVKTELSDEEASNSNALVYEATSPAPSIYACYSSGRVLANGAYKQAGICGESEGTIHDCYFIASGVSTGDAVAENYGVLRNDTVKGLDAAGDLQTKAFVAQLNEAASVDDFEEGNCFVPDLAEKDSQVNGGYPVFAWQRAAGTLSLDESKLAYDGTAEAAYSASINPLPKLKVTLGSTELVCGADFYCVPDDAALDASGSCKQVSELKGTTLHARICGMGDYANEGATTWTAPYTLGTCDFDYCTVQILSKTYNFLPQYPAQPTDAEDSEVIVYDASGKRVPASSYTMADDPKTCIDYHVTPANTAKDGVKHEGYEIEFTAKEDSSYRGSTYGYFNICQAALISSSKARITGITFNGQHWLYSMSEVYGGGVTASHVYRMVDGVEVAGMQIPYTGESIKPTIDAFMYKDGNGVEHELELGVDYRVVYGDPGSSADLIATDAKNPNLDVSSSEIGKRACFTYRYSALNSVKRYNFCNYQYIFFDIVAADLSNPEHVSIELPDAYDLSKDASQVVVKGATGATISSDNYTVDVKTLSSAKVKLTITGTNNCTGVYTATLPTTGAVSIAKAKVKLSSSTLPYTGKPLKPSVKVVLDKKTLKKGSDYTLAYSSNKAIGKAKVTVKGVGSYIGSVAKSFTIVPPAPKKPTLKAASKKLSASWKAVAGKATGYQLRYATKKSMSGAKQAKVKKTSFAKKLKAKMRYYVQVRAYKRVGGKTYWGAWSAKASAKTKK